jgi:hypothetical protein
VNTRLSPSASPPAAPPETLQESAESLRCSALDLLEAAADAGLPAGVRGDVVERLQRVGNDLQVAASRLSDMRPLQGHEHAPADLAPPLSQDAAIVLALALTAMPFAYSEADQAERWLRILRLHGRVGAVLQAIGVPERPFETLAEPFSGDAEGADAVVSAVSETAADFARRHGAKTVDTVHVLMAVLAVQGPAFDRALYARGTSREEIFDRISESRRRASF